MAQFDNDQAQMRDNNNRTTMNSTGYGRSTTTPDKRQRQHLLLSSSSSSSSSTASSSLSDGGCDGNTNLLSFAEAHRILSERDHLSGHLQQQANHLERRQRGSINQHRQQRHAMSLHTRPKAKTGDLDEKETGTTSNRSSGQLNRQHSDGSSIGAQLMNVLKINDDLNGSSSETILFTKTTSSTSNMLMTQTQEQHHQSNHHQRQHQTKELDTRLNSSGNVLENMNSATYKHHQQVITTPVRQPLPLVVVSHADQQYQEHYPPHTSHHQHYQSHAGYEQYQPLVADQLVHAEGLHVFHQQNNNDHHYHHDHAGGQPTGMYQHSENPYDQLMGDDAQLSYADLDEETTRHHQQQQQRRRASSPNGNHLPECVIRVNEQMMGGQQQQQQQQQQQAFYPHQLHHHDQHQHHEQQPTYTDMTRGSPTALLRHEPTGLGRRLHDDSSTTLTALNSAAACEPDQRQRHAPFNSSFNNSLKQSSGSWHDKLTELSEASGPKWASCDGPAKATTRHPLEQPSNQQLASSFTSACGNHEDFEGANNAGDDDDDDDDADDDDDDDDDHREPHRRRNQHHHYHQRNSMSSVGLDAAQASQPSNDIDEELKVCEWRDCGNTFMEMNEFVRHLEEKHVNMEPQEKNRYFCLWHNCKRNKQEFNARYKLLIHMRVHSGEKPYSCQSASCKKSFSRLENLKIHVRSHTGEKPYKCNYEHCSKSFTNSSDRIKHHKTHKDPKPYNCTREGCTKRYTDPSSLRKHLRAHKRHSSGSMDSCESPGAPNLRYSAATSNFSVQIDQTFAQSSLSAAPNEQNHQQHRDHHHNKHYHHQQGQYQYMEAAQHQQMGGNQPYEHQQQQQQQDVNYLHADYDPSKEFADVLFSSSNVSEMARPTHEGAPAAEEANYYVNSNFDAAQQPAQRQQSSFMTNLDESATGQSQQQARQQYETTSNRHYQRPVVRFRPSQTRLHECHQQLSKSWCGSGGLKASRPAPWSDDGPARYGAQRAAFQEETQTDSQQQGGEPASSQAPRKRVEFECAPTTTRNYQPSGGWSLQAMQQTDEAAYANYSNQPLVNRASDEQYEQNRPLEHIAQLPADNNHQRQIHYQPGQEQEQQQQQQQQKQQLRLGQLTRRQQHEQLMASMPANVGLFHS